MRVTAALIVTLLAASGAAAQVLPTPFPTVRSMSGQFVVFGPRTPSVHVPVRGATNANWLTLEPTLVTVSAERIKQAVWRELGCTDGWQSKIGITLRTARTGGEPVRVLVDRSLGTWSYRVELPDQITKERYLRAIVEVVLLELANRGARERAAEIPAWLIEGMTMQVAASSGPDLVLTSPRQSWNGVTFNPPVTKEIRQLSPLEKAHKTLLGETPLTFEELSWPVPGQIEGDAGAHYRACAQLLLYNLQRLRGGKDCLREFVGALPQYLNWQMAFLQGFKPHFARPLDIEKWWALQSTGFVSRDLIQTWTYEESWDRLTAALAVPVDVHGQTNELPLRSEVKMQSVVRDWDFARQEPALRNRVDELEALRTFIAPELQAITADYSQALSAYLKLQSVAADSKRGRAQPSRSVRGQRELLKILDALDARAAKMRPKGATMR